MEHTVEMIVSLKVPDATAYTALKTMQKLGLAKVMDARRADYYKFWIGDDEEKFRQRISKVDVIVNANKNSFEFALKNDSCINMLIRNLDDNCSSIQNILKKRLGFKSISKMERAKLWSLKIDANENESRKIAEKAAKELLVNENYQSYEVI